MKRYSLFLLLLLAVSVPVFTQVIHDPYDQLYRDLDAWAVRGYITQLPPVRPYPIQLIEELLRIVENNGSPAASAKAASYRRSVGRNVAHPSGSAAIVGLDDDSTPLAKAGIDAFFRPEPWMGISVSFDSYAAMREVGEEIRISGIYSPYPDMVNDNSFVGSYQILQNWNSLASFGTGNLYFQTGLSRGSYGPFFETGTVYGPQAAHAGHFSLVYRGDRWSASVLHLALTASDQFYDGQRNKYNWYPNKHMILHSFDFMVLPGLELGFFESVVYGDRLELMYLAPFNFLFQAQGVSGFLDNSFLGLNFSWLIQPGLKLAGQVYVDDLSFNSLSRLDFDTKYKLSGQLGIALVPRRGILESLHVDYTAIMPYMYTHNWDLDPADYIPVLDAGVIVNRKPVYSNYLHMGQPLGTELLPNSDRLSLRSSWRLLPGLRLNLGGELVHHGNASSNYNNPERPDTIGNDGGYLDDGRDDAGRATFNSKTRFLTQDVIETIARLSQGVEVRIPTMVGTLGLNADCLVEFGWNRSRVGEGPVAGNDSVLVYYTLGLSWRY